MALQQRPGPSCVIPKPRFEPGSVFKETRTREGPLRGLGTLVREDRAPGSLWSAGPTPALLGEPHLGTEHHCKLEGFRCLCGLGSCSPYPMSRFTWGVRCPYTHGHSETAHWGPLKMLSGSQFCPSVCCHLHDICSPAVRTPGSVSLLH